MRPPGGFPGRRIFTPDSVPNLPQQQPRQLGTVHLRPLADLSGFEKGPLPDLAGPIAVIGTSASEVIGGMPTRLAVAAHLYSRLLDNHEPPEASRKALNAADVLIAMDLSDRQEAIAKAEELAKQSAA